ncbi:hypothetical protein GCM10023320_39870 [Pseudonocardia adelaidensis]|uniref:RpiR family transcriptional regulator n=1 Tax=Pseudonocardia adelaidensis TaxID=648754 RepID=A0ABP9NMK5_9PSEU
MGTAATNARNVLVYRFDVDEPEATPAAPEIYALAELTASVITLILLQEIGLSIPQLARLAAEHQSFWRVRKG